MRTKGIPYLNRSDLRLILTDKFLAMDEEGLGDFEYEQSNLNHYLYLSASALFPSYYVIESAAVTPTSYGSAGLGYVETDNADRIFLIEDADELEPVVGWHISANRILGIDTTDHPSVNIYWYAPLEFPDDDEHDFALPTEFVSLLILGATIEALESKHDSGLIGQGDVGRRYAGVHEEMPVVDRLYRRYQALQAQIGLNIPTVMC